MITVVIVAHAQTDGAATILGDLAAQTRPASETLIFYSDMPAVPGGIEVPNLKDWGHEKRAMGLAQATGQYVSFWNADDHYDPRFLEVLAGLLDQGHDLAACDFNSHVTANPLVETEPKAGRITSGNFVVRRSLAQEVGYLGRHYEADWAFVEGVMKAGASFVRHPEVLYFHR